jgi:hypothetical protein
MGEREGQGTAFESLAPRTAVQKPAVCAWANSFGVLYPKLLCGRSSLYSILHAAILRRASNRFWNQLRFKHSSRIRPLKLSTRPFCVGFPGWMVSVRSAPSC